MREIGGKRRMLTACCIILMSLALQACREDEQGQVLLYDKGTYLGKADQTLTEAQREALRHRTSLQRAQ
jgi:hypothetical protein